MAVLSGFEPKRVFEIFEEISAIPRSSGNMDGIASYCMAFAKTHNLRAIRDNSDNVILFKEATAGYETAEPVLLQGHLDMVCQKTPDCTVDFTKDGLSLFTDGDYIRAKGTTLGADNGIAVAMILAVLESASLWHPAIEAVFTTDEEVGMIGASALDISLLQAKRMINLDSEDKDCVTVSCAGGSDFSARLPITKKTVTGTPAKLRIHGLKGGHSGICIHEGRVNANILAGRLLSMIKETVSFDICLISGGDKGNAIPLQCEILLCIQDTDAFFKSAKAAFDVLKEELAMREPNLAFELTIEDAPKKNEVFDDSTVSGLLYTLLFTPNGVIDMSKEIDGLVETSLNLGVLKGADEEILFHFALRSNKKTALMFLEQRLTVFFKAQGAKITTSGHYPPWEYNSHSVLQELYTEAYQSLFGEKPRVEAIHAGLECGVFADKIDGFDGIAIGPQMYDVHTVNERLSISSVGEIYKLLTEILAKCH